MGSKDKKGRILVIDDEEHIRLVFEASLAREGHEVSTAGNYEEALRQISEKSFDLIFADIFLGGKTGVNVLQEIRSKDMWCPVVIMTGYPHLDTASEALRLRAFDYLPKPVQMDKLLDVTAKALKHGAFVNDTTMRASNLDGIFRSIRSAIVAFRDDLEVIETNEAARKLCGFSPGDKQKVLDGIEKRCACRCRDVLVKTIRERRSNERTHIECMLRQRPEQVVAVKSFPLLGSQGTPVGTVLVIEDETAPRVAGKVRQGRSGFPGIIGESPAVRKIYDLMESLTEVQTTVLITGGSGTGKELVAEALHYGGARARGPLVKVNCAALPDALLESELFGHVKGAFTDAVHDRVGRFQKADGGTIFLDEIGDISAGMQTRLLRVLESMEFERVGDSTPVKVNVRIIAATNKNIPERVRKGTFREDLYYRLKVIEISMPPLRDRKEDIPLLIEHFTGKLNAKLNRTIEGVSSDVMKILKEYSWPGNIRELEHAIEHAFIHCSLPIVTVKDLPHEIREFIKTKTPLLHYENCEERQAILRALEVTYWNRTRAAALLGMSRRTFYRKIKEHNIYR